MKTHHRMSHAEREARAAATEQVQQAVQAAMDRRDNGGETGHSA
ncbi:MAG TPA: hypothetical protein VFU93_15550 [Acidimicrobiales bacterium]|nr:hypothetical protein [Acidimicrobiales bacterium]